VPVVVGDEPVVGGLVAGEEDVGGDVVDCGEEELQGGGDFGGFEGGELEVDVLFGGASGLLEGEGGGGQEGKEGGG